ncbi:MAG: elongation factor [Candidatus Cloacimonetes bacterium HGW-Cloacimonetes-1]|jgi:uncharacterized YigZ family protein|nr:MAG: elongation factor [Candidatus Cloacimonetes bacterium HGW-Cloacimonetes-1]
MIYTLTTTTQYEVKIQRSHFIAFLFPVQTTEQVRDILSEHNKEYGNATHNCYAYVLGSKQQTQYYSDAGEPSGTAGKPILNAILRKELTNVLAIVTRYYGGVKLGVKGLIEAYGQSVQAAIEASHSIVYKETLSLNGECEYSSLDSLKYRIEDLGADLEATEYSQRVTVKITVPVDALEDLKEILKSYATTTKFEI